MKSYFFHCQIRTRDLAIVPAELQKTTRLKIHVYGVGQVYILRETKPPCCQYFAVLCSTIASDGPERETRTSVHWRVDRSGLCYVLPTQGLPRIRDNCP